MKLIAFGHEKHVGKDTAAKFLITHVRTHLKNSNIKLVGFSDKLKEQMHDVFKWAGLKDGCYYEQYPEEKNKPLPGLINCSARDIWIHYGNLMRNLYPNIWIEFLLNQYKDKDVILVIKDLRYPNEANRILESGGHIFKIVRPSIAHTSDAADDALLGYDKWTAIINNNTDLNWLYQQVIELGQQYLGVK